MLDHFGFAEYDMERHEEALTAMINFCYTGSYGLPNYLEHESAPQEIQQSYSLLHMFCQLARPELRCFKPRNIFT